MADSLNDKLGKMLSGMNNPAAKVKLQKVLDLIKSGKADDLIKGMNANDKGKMEELAKKINKLTE